MTFVTRRLLPLLILGGLLCPQVRADPPSPAAEDGKAASAGREDLIALVESLREDMEPYQERPDWPGHDGKFHEAWFLNMKRRAARMRARPKEMAKENLWIYEEDAEQASWLKPDQWSGAVRRLSSLYTELGTVQTGYRKVKVKPDAAYRRWDKQNPEPSLRGLTSAGYEIQRLNRLLAQYRYDGWVWPRRLAQELARWIVLEAEEIRQREERHRQWQAERKKARLAILESVRNTQAALVEQGAVFSDQMAKVRAICAAMQVAEEGRLRSVLGKLPTEDPVQAEAAKRLKEMKKGRRKALAYSGSRTTEWGKLIRQGWTVPRTKLLSAIKKYEQRVKKAARLAAEEADGK